MGDLRRYRQKRSAEKTPEPMGEEAGPRLVAGGAPRAFVVQQHAARRMHWDLRLEIGEVLASWAVPRGPSHDPADKRLAVRTEDHPLEYADFEGVIPKGNYGAGAMIVWDRGVWRSADGKDATEGVERGKLDFYLEGHKLHGRFTLVKTRGENEWLLIAKGTPPPEDVEQVVVERLPHSVLSGLTVDELFAGKSLDEELSARADAAGAKRGTPDVAKLRPMLCQTVKDPFSDPGWVFELKLDGARVLAAKQPDGTARLVARSGRDVTTIYPEISRALPHLPVESCILDGEVAVLDARGIASFQRLQGRWGLGDAAAIARAELEHPVVYFAFDLLAVTGRDLRRLPLLERKALLAELVPRKGFLRFVDHLEGDGELLHQQVVEHGIEGVVAKRADSPYETGRRSSHWKKIKAPQTDALVVVGFVPEKGMRTRIGALHLAWWRNGALRHAGRAGSGIDEAASEALRERLVPLAIDAPAFEEAPARPPAGTQWVQPELVVEVRYTQVTRAGTLRQPVFRGLRDDLEPADCVAPGEAREPEPTAQAPPAQTEAELKLTRLEKVFWPVEGYTKGDLLGWYEAVWPWLEPYLADRPVVLTRYPDGIEGKSFYQKNAPDFTPDWVKREIIEGTEYFVCHDLRTLLYVINLGAIPLHVWSARLADLDRPDWLLIDLDPKDAPFAHVVEVARHLHARLGEFEAAHFVKTSGQDGLHVMLPLAGALDHRGAKQLGEALARLVVSELPEIATVTRPLAGRGGKVYVDYLQNGRGKLVASPFSVRPRPGAPVSMPLTWRQVTKRLDPAQWTIQTALPRLERHGDPLAGVLGPGIDVAALLEAMEAHAAR